jgi:hypothetical protein
MSSVEKTLVDVRRILWEDWDPIGVSNSPEAPTEYDSYAPTVVSMLFRGCSAHDLEHHLARLETDSMGLATRPSSSRAEVVAHLLALRGGR